LISFLALFELFAAYFDIEVLNTPLKSFLVGVEEYVKSIPADGTAPIEDFYGQSVFVTWDGHLGAKRVLSIGRDKGITGAYFVSAGGLAI